MSDEHTIVDRNDPELKYLTVEKNQFSDPATQAEWTQKRLVWVPHETQVIIKFTYRSEKIGKQRKCYEKCSDVSKQRLSYNFEFCGNQLS